MDKSIYEGRAAELDAALSPLLSRLERNNFADDDARSAAWRDLASLSKMETENARILLQIEQNELRALEIGGNDAASSEKHEVEVEQNKLKDRELSIREADEAEQRKLKERELELREFETKMREREMESQTLRDEKRADVETKAAIGRVAVGVLELAGVALQVGVSAFMLTKAMRFETADNGGILSPKFFNHAFRLK